MSTKEKVLKTVAKGAGIAFCGVMISKIFTYLFRVVTAHLGSDAYGLFSIIIAIYGILGGITVLGTEMGIIRFVSLLNEQNQPDKISALIRHAIKKTFSFSLIISSLTFIFAETISTGIFHDTRLIPLIQLASLFAPVNTLRKIFLNSLLGFKKIYYETIAKAITENFVKLVLSVILLYLGFNAFGAVLAYILGVTASTIIAFYLLEKKVFSLINTKPDKSYSAKPLFVYSLPLMFSILVYLVILWIDTLMLGYFENASTVGIYNAALPTAQVLMVFPNALTAIFLPVLSTFKTFKEEEFISLYKTITKWIILINGAFFILMVIFSKQFLNVVFGKEYSLGSVALVILSIGYFIHFLLIPGNNVLLALHHTKLIFLNNAIAALTNFFLNLILIPKYGIIGASIGTCIALIVMGVLMLAETIYFTKVNPFSSRMINVSIALLIASSVLWVIVSRFNFNSTFMIIIGAMIFGAIYLLTLFITRSFDDNDKLIFYSTLSKIGLRKNH